MSGDLTKEYHASAVDARELIQILTQNSSGFGNIDQSLYFHTDNSEDAYAVEVVFSKRTGKVCDIKSGPQMTSSLRQKLKDQIEIELIAETGTVIANRILFCVFPVRNFYRYKDVFQIFPVPEDAPQPNWFQGDHSLLLQCRIRASINPLVQNIRAYRATQDIERLLCGLVDTSMHALIPWQGWALIPPNYAETAEYCAGYAYDGYTTYDSDFQARSGEAFARLPAWQVAHRAITTAREVLVLPENLDDLLGCFFRLPTNQQQKVIRSCFWLQRARWLFLQPRIPSLAFICLVNAIEALMGEGAPCECPKCQSRHQNPSKTRMFREFMNTYGRTPAGVEHEAKLLTELYGKRSALVHGSSLLVADDGEWSTPTANREEDDVRSMLGLVQLSIMNWLAAQ